MTNRRMCRSVHVSRDRKDAQDAPLTFHTWKNQNSHSAQTVISARKVRVAVEKLDNWTHDCGSRSCS